MSDAAQPAATDATTSSSAGQLLRQARESAGLHIGALAVALKVPVLKIEALENDRTEDLPDAVFARALAGSVCRHLKVDPRPVLAALPQGRQPLLPEAEPSLDTMRMPGGTYNAVSAGSGLLKNPVVLASAGLVLAALVVYWLPASDGGNSSGNGPPGPVKFAADVPAFIPAPSTVAPATPEPQAPISDPPAASAAVAPPTSKTSAESASAAAAVADGVLQINALGETWVEVLDSQADVLLRKTLRAGETMGVNGALPLRVTIGRADAAQVKVRGSAFDVSKVSRDNVARFEVK